LPCRYQDDLYSINGGDILAAEWTDIYPECLQLTKENENDANTHFLDLSITINDGKQIISIYDKRDAFPFDVVCFPDLTGNISFRKTHSVLLGQLRRYSRGCHELKHFKLRTGWLTTRLIKQSFSKEILRYVVARFFQSRPDLKIRYGIEDKDIYGACFEDDQPKQSSVNG
jgi:hypothetical protein